MRWPKDWSFTFSIIPSKKIPGLISFRMDWLDFLVVQGTLTIGRWMDEKAVVLLVVMYGCESWTRKLLRVPWTARRSNQSILKEISPGISLEGMMLKLKLQYFSHLMRRVDSLEKTLMLGGIGGRRRRG